MNREEKTERGMRYSYFIPFFIAWIFGDLLFSRPRFSSQNHCGREQHLLVILPAADIESMMTGGSYLPTTWSRNDSNIACTSSCSACPSSTLPMTAASTSATAASNSSLLNIMPACAVAISGPV